MKPPGSIDLKSAEHLQEVVAFLQCDLLQNILLLKMLTAYAEAVQCYYLNDSGAAGVLLLLPVRVSAFDRQLYPAVDTIVFLTRTEADTVQALLAYVPTGCNLVFKLTDSRIQALVAQAFKLRRMTAYISYTTPAGYQGTPVAGVVISNRVDERFYELYRRQGYGREEVAHSFATGQARSFARYDGPRPIASCFTIRTMARSTKLRVSIPSRRSGGKVTAGRW